MRPPRAAPPGGGRSDAGRGRVKSSLALALTLLAVATGVHNAIRNAWICDDAFISFRYAQHLVRGEGLVFNPGERVEGFTNLLWTLWIAAGMRLDIPPEIWSEVWGVAFHGGAILLLGLNAWLRSRALGYATAVPIAAILAAFHPDWSLYATSGLESSLLVFLSLLGYLLVVSRSGARGLAAAGVALALASLTRPDGVLFAGLAGAYVLWTRRPLARSALACGAAFLAVWLPCQIWRVSYYGDFFPNTYYAKSAYLSWFDQGWTYVRLYFQQYWILLAGLIALPLALSPAPRGASDATALRTADRAAFLAAAMALAYTFYVMKVGGDFMYARLLIPATPFYLVALEWVLARAARGAWLPQAGAAAAALVALALTPESLPGEGWVRGIVNESRIYTAQVRAETRREGEILKRYFEGLPVRVAFVGSQAGLIYYAEPAVAIESQTGLTDRVIARQPLEGRGRVGHEKLAPLEYLIERRKVHLVLRHFATRTLDLDAAIPNVVVAFDSVYARMVHWDPAMAAELRSSGARFADFPEILDAYALEMDLRSDAQVRADYEQARRFYFAHVDDPARERPFLARLGGGR